MIENKKELNVISLFNGMGCIWLAMEEAGLKVGNRFSSEIEKYPNQANDVLYPDTVQLGDVRNVKGSELGFVDFLAGGSPCQSFSFAGKRKGMSTKCEIQILTLNTYLELKSQEFEFEGQSYLFWEYIRILEEIRVTNPNVKYLLENVTMGKKWQKTITQAIGVNPIKINSALVSAQNRDRLYWTNLASEQFGLFGDNHCTIKQPKNENILLKDVLETFETSNYKTPEEFNEYMKKYYLSEKMLKYLNTRKANYNNGKINYKTPEDVASCINASSGHLDISDNIIVVDDDNASGFVNDNGKMRLVEKGSCLDANYHKGMDNHAQRTLIVYNTMPRSSKTGKGGTGLLSRDDGKTYCLDTGSTNAIEFVSTKRVRKLTPRECGRLQTVPEHQLDKLLKSGISDTQLYKIFGNGWTIKVIAHILKHYHQ